MAEIFPVRSALFVPADNPRAMSKIRELEADLVILDLEDAVAPARKDAAREAVTAAFRSDSLAGKRGVICINSLETAHGPWDVAACAGLRAHALLIPKVERAADLSKAARAVRSVTAPGDLALWAMIETPLGVLNAGEIAGGAGGEGRLECLVAGSNDLATALRLPAGANARGLETALSMIVLSARAFDLLALDGVFNEFDNAEGFARACAHGRALGFDGKTLIHPRQIHGANSAFSPDPEALRDARAIVAAFAAAGPEVGVLGVEGRMVERLHLREAERLIALAGHLAGTGRPR